MRRIIHDFMHYNRGVQHNLKDRLTETLSAEEWVLLRKIGRGARQLGMPLYAVGGLPRDLILGRPVGDFDLVVEGKAERLAKVLVSKYGGRATVHAKFGTAKWVIGAPVGWRRRSGAVWRSVDLVTARSETYRHPAALPTVQPGTIEDDLRRRDFTINAVAVRLDAPHTGIVRDDFGGWHDIEAGLVRALHDQSFIDDPTRMFRAVRYEQRYGFRIASDTLALFPPGLPVVTRLSAQRARHELDLLLDEPQFGAMLSRLAALHVLEAIHPALAFDPAAGSRMAGAGEAPPSLSHVPARDLRWIAWLITMPQAEIRSINERLHFGAALFKACMAASELWRELPSIPAASPSSRVDRLDGVPLSAVYTAYIASHSGPERLALGDYLERLRHVRPVATGHELKRLGLKPGAVYKRILGELRRAWLDGDVQSLEQERAYLEALVKRAEEEGQS